MLYSRKVLGSRKKVRDQNFVPFSGKSGMQLGRPPPSFSIETTAFNRSLSQASHAPFAASVVPLPGQATCSAALYIPDNCRYIAGGAFRFSTTVADSFERGHG